MRHEFEIGNLNCANCASKIERELNKYPKFEEVNLNFMLKKITLKTKAEMSKEEVQSYIQTVSDRIEEGVEIISVGKKAKRDEDSHSHSHYHEHSHEIIRKNTGIGKYVPSETALLVISIVLAIGGLVLQQDLLLILAYIFIGYDVIWKAFRNCLKGKMLDENFLMTVATIAAFTIGEYPEAVAVMFFYKIGEYMQDKAVDYSTREIEKAMDIRPDFARAIRGNKEWVGSPKEIKIDEIIEVRPGEKVPLDGVIIEGESMLDTSMLTGESLPSFVKKDDSVLSGSINKDGIIKIRVMEEFHNSTVSKILELIQNASSKKSKSENFITKFARWYTPIVVIGAILVAIVPSLIAGNWEHWIYTSIVFLVISCPCALVISVPLGFFGGIGAASKAGVLVKGSNYLEELNEIETIVLDKTGTITKGKFGVVNILTHEVSKEQVLEVAVTVESFSNHPIAKSIVKAYGKEIPRNLEVVDYKEVGGQGISAKVGGEEILVGNETMMESYGLRWIDSKDLGSKVHVAKAGKYLGCIIVADEIKEDSKAAIRSLKEKGIKRIVMLTGDHEDIANKIGEEIGIDEVYARLLPQDKVVRLEEELKGGKVAFVGDGINDAPVLARATIGIAMGGVGSDAAIEASDIVLMTDKLSSIGDVLEVAKTTRRIVTQNIVFALGIKVIVLLLGLVGMANMWLAVFADVGVSLLAVLNSMRILGKDQSFIIEAIKGKK